MLKVEVIPAGFLDNFGGMAADDLPTNIQAVRRFLAVCTAEPMPAEDFETAVYYNAVVPAQIRANLGARQIDGDDLLRTLMVPLLVTQGRLDPVVLPAVTARFMA